MNVYSTIQILKFGRAGISAHRVGVWRPGGLTPRGVLQLAQARQLKSLEYLPGPKSFQFLSI